MEIANIHTHKSTSADVFVGRPRKNMPSVLGNPFTHIQDGKTTAEYVCKSRAEAISEHKKWLKKQIRECNRTIIDAMLNLNDQSILVCYCDPQPCHARNIIDAYYWLVSDDGFKFLKSIGYYD